MVMNKAYSVTVTDKQSRLLGGMFLIVPQKAKNIPTENNVAKCHVLTFNDLFDNLVDQTFSDELEQNNQSNLPLPDGAKDDIEAITEAMDKAFKIPVNVIIRELKQETQSS